MTTMLYKCPGPHDIHGGQFDYKIVEDGEIDAALADGWKLTTPEAKQAHKDLLDAQAAEREKQAEEEAAKALADANSPPTRAELEEMAQNLGLPFNGRTSDKKLADLIKAATEQPATVVESAAAPAPEPQAETQEPAVEAAPTV